ncbi:MAG: hypothetical protein QXX17_04575 [Conexivisphaerales archaeon]
MKKSKSPIVLTVSTSSGLYLLENDSRWSRANHYLREESVNNVYRASNGTLFASTLTNGVFASTDGKTWRSLNRGLNVRKVWTVEEDMHQEGTLYAGTQYGHMFVSRNEGEEWEEVTGLFGAPNRNKWGIDWGFGTTGLTIHTIKSDPFKKGRLYIVVSGNGVYRSDDNGETWKVLKKGLANRCPVASRIDAPETPAASSDSNMTAKEHLKRVHSCTHKLAVSSKTEGLLFQQNHCGIYISKDSGENWMDNSPSDDMRHGFGIAISSDDKVFVIPAYQGICKEHLSCIRGRIKVLSTSDMGKTWEEHSKGLPEKAHTCVLRDAIAVARGKPAQVFFGTTTGEVYYSSDEGESWKLLLRNAGRIQGISALPAS